MATTMLTATLLIIGNLVADILYGIVDPRIRNMR
jgi:peptide/nickel transport system permease protein